MSVCRSRSRDHHILLFVPTFLYLVKNPKTESEDMILALFFLQASLYLLKIPNGKDTLIAGSVGSASADAQRKSEGIDDFLRGKVITPRNTKVMLK